jgi:trehalose 6-phosphate synthase
LFIEGQEMEKMPRLVVVSNRVADLDCDGEASKGGLAMAMAAALRHNGGLWFGWSGDTTPLFDPHPKIRWHGQIQTALVDLEQEAVDQYYNGFANRTLWPLCHHRIDLAVYERDFSAYYTSVNDCFAESLAPLLRPDDVIWVHDYHLIPLARALRQRGVTNRIGFFLHIPWPAPEILATMPRHHDLVQSMFDYDLLGFQTQDWLQAFQNYVAGELHGHVDAPSGTISAFGRTVIAHDYPIGLDMAEMRDLVRSPEAQDSYRAMRESSGDQKLLLGVDRIDYTKGLPHKFAGYAQFLGDHPEWLERTFLLQIGQPSRTGVEDYADLQEELLSEAGRMNGALGTLDWSPLRFRSQSMPRNILAGVYRAADVALVTPLRDGMNLVAKEYVAAQDPADPGVLILSRFAGAAAQMPEALVVNPYSREDLADAIRRALEMSLSERLARWKSLHAGVVRDDLDAWYKAFLKDLNGADMVADPGERLHYT